MTPDERRQMHRRRALHMWAILIPSCVLIAVLNLLGVDLSIAALIAFVPMFLAWAIYVWRVKRKD